ncbi:hypothetical protein AMIS_44710 [Actinoplanes missouriensis 431]|uniref:Uncharacterized protein n=1 Tax=Actinoplanes missouriensis (strain ATCC 14538 / DSM 43046 / CBS 188.64 / JCM 3121 / NBRC 102363 / NCIMB 12654 / NRRL B-3342 / UNCC 431) TaxID=512565 RepID=I0H9K4_ACTM4|nr:hypothetical protein [Actinoplanes missouriensis]BAL89691.1 hypothetical protein AMIS_44710 [Actinoplanes missouriensis 431]
MQHDDEVRRFRIEADAVREFRFETEGGGRPWFYAEVTDADMEKVPDQLIPLTLLLWSEDHTITIRAASVLRPGPHVVRGRGTG